MNRLCPPAKVRIVNRQPLREGVLVIGAWTEDDNEGSLRARITSQPSTGNAESSSYAASPEDVLARVRQWLELLLGEMPHDEVPGSGDATVTRL